MNATAKLFADRADACAVLVEMLVEKGIISRSEVVHRFQRVRAAGLWPGSRVVARDLADLVAYLQPDDAGAAPLDRTALLGETILLVEREVAVSRALQATLERAGAEVLVAHTPADALPRITQFDFSAAVVEWRPDTREQRTLLRWLHEDGVRFLFCADRLCLSDEAMTAGDRPVVLKSAPPQELVAALARLTAAFGNGTAQ